MSLLAQLLVDDDKDLSIDVSFTNFTKNLQITKENSIVYNRFDVSCHILVYKLQTCTSCQLQMVL